MKSEGLSTVELLVVMAIMAVIFSIATSIMNMYARARVEKTRDDILSALEKARISSITSVPHGLKCSTNSFEVVVLKDGICEGASDIKCADNDDCQNNGPCGPGNYRLDSGEETKTIEKRNIPTKLKLCCLSSCSTHTIWFDRKGVPRDASWGLGMTTIEIKNEENNETLEKITISASGRIKSEK